MKKHMPIHLLSFAALLLLCLTPLGVVKAQDYVTGSFEGQVKDSVTGDPVVGATVRILNQETGVPIARQTGADGHFSQNLLPPGEYTITVIKQGYVSYSTQRSLSTMRPTVVLPPVPLVADSGGAMATATPTPGAVPSKTPTEPASTGDSGTTTHAGIRQDINTNDGQRGGTYSESEVTSLPLGGTTLTRSFDELGQLLPGVALPPETQGLVAGPGVGAGVGSAGQFSVNGLRSRANNFTVDGSDNNDEDIGVRRQGFFALVPQPVESIKEFQMITLLAPAQFGRNFGAQVNAISKSGGNDTHGAVYGLFNSSQLNSRNVFDTVGGNTVTNLRSDSLDVLTCAAACSNLKVRLNNGGKDSSTLAQGGLVIGGPLTPNKMFYFFSFEGQLLNANREVSFAVPTVAERGFGRTGASGIFKDPFGPRDANGNPTANAFAFPTTFDGDAIFSLFPFANNPTGVYGANTFTQVLPAGAQGKIASGKFDRNFNIGERQQAFTARYNFTEDWRDIPSVGGGIFARLRPNVRTQNFSTFLNSELTGPNATNPLFNQLRLSYGRTRLTFEEGHDNEFLIPTQRNYANLEDRRFLLNAPLLSNFSLPDAPGFASTTPVIYANLFAAQGRTTEDRLGPVGQVVIAGFSPIGVDVFNFPQRRVNNTYQLADTMTLRVGNHSIAFGTDNRRTELNSDLPRNSRPLLTFNGAPDIQFNRTTETFNFTNRFIRPVDLAAAGAASGVFQTLRLPGTSSDIALRYYQLNFFAQDEWRIRPNLSLSYGVRYEYNTVPKERNRRIENTFDSPLLNLAPGLRTFIDGRSSIYDADPNNIAPRVGIAWSPQWFGSNHTTVLRAGYGIFYDQILGAVVSQSRNVFPSALTVNLAGGSSNLTFPDIDFPLDIINPSNPGLFLIRPGTLNTLDINSFTLEEQIDFLNAIAGGNGFVPGNPSNLGLVLPARDLETPMAHHYSATFEQQLSRDIVFSAAYVGTLGRKLLRLTTPNLGQNALIVPVFGTVNLGAEPALYGLAVPPGTRLTPAGVFTGGRPQPNVGAINIYETTASSRYDALQLQLRGRYNFLGATQFQVAYTYGKATDDVSDVFDLAGASALPQNSITFAGERAPANFDVRHRVSSNYVSDFSSWGKNNSFLHAIFNGLEIAGTGQFQTGQPFTVNSILDVNLDGNLTDRLNTTSGIRVTGDRFQPLVLTAGPLTQLAPLGQDGAVPRNSFRAGNIWVTNASLIKSFGFAESKKLVFRADVFNLFNRDNYGIPVRFLEAPSFGKATETVTPARRIQLGVKFAF